MDSLPPKTYKKGIIRFLSHHSLSVMFYNKGSYDTWGNFPSVEWILENLIITTNSTDNILWLVDSWCFKLSIDHHLWTVRPVVKDLSMLKTKCWWIFKLWHSYLCHKTWDMSMVRSWILVRPDSPHWCQIKNPGQNWLWVNLTKMNEIVASYCIYRVEIWLLLFILC